MNETEELAKQFFQLRATQKLGSFASDSIKSQRVDSDLNSTERRERVRAWKRNWVRRNKDKVAKTTREWKAKNPDRVRALDKLYRDSNREKVNLSKRAWDARNPDKLIEYQARRELLRNFSPSAKQAAKETIPSMLVEAKKIQLLILREIKAK